MPEETKKEMGNEIQSAIAEKIRQDSKRLARLTGVDSLHRLAPDLGYLEFVAVLSQMITDARYGDIKLMTLLDAGPHAVYLCSDRYMARENIEKLLEVEGIQTAIAARVRERAEKLNKLTPIDSLDVVAPVLGRGAALANLAAMFEDNRYRDIKLVAAAAGAGPVYLCSDRYIARENAEKLLRTEETQARIAEMVRQGSKDFARRLGSAFSAPGAEGAPKAAVPTTGADASSAPVFNVLGSDRVELSFADMLKDDRYQDIKSAVNAKGDVYLYSERYLPGNYAEILVAAEGNDPCNTIAALVREGSRAYGQPTSIELFREPAFNIDPDELEANIARVLEQPKYEDIKQVHASSRDRYLYSNLHLDEARAIILAGRAGRRKGGKKRPPVVKR